MVMIWRIIAVLFLAVTCNPQCTQCDGQHVINIPQQTVPVQSFAANNQRPFNQVTNQNRIQCNPIINRCLPCCSILQPSQSKQVYLWYGPRTGDGQQAAGVFSNASTNTQQQQQQQYQQDPPPFAPPGGQGQSGTISQQPAFPISQTGSGSNQQEGSVPGPIPQPGATPLYMDQPPGGQNEFGSTQFQSTTSSYNNLFLPVTPDLGTYTTPPQSVGPVGGSYDNANAEYHGAPSNVYPTTSREFGVSGSDRVSHPPVTSIASSYDGQNAGGSEGYAQASGLIYDGTATVIPDQIGASSTRGTSYPPYLIPGVLPQTQSSTPANQDFYIPSGQPSQWTTPTYLNRDQELNEFGSPSPSPQWMGGGSYTSSTSSQDQQTSPSYPTAQQFEATRPDSIGPLYGTSTPSSYYQVATQFEYGSTQNPIPSTTTMRPSQADEYSPSASQLFDSSTMQTPLFTEQQTVTPSTPAPFVYQTVGPVGVQPGQEFIPTIEPTGTTDGGYDSTGGTSVPETSLASTRYGQDPEGTFVQARPSTNTVPQTPGEAPSYGTLSDSGESTQNASASTAEPSGDPGTRPLYDFQHNMNTVYGNYENWPSATRQQSNSPYTNTPEQNNLAPSTAFSLITTAIALLL